MMYTFSCLFSDDVIPSVAELGEYADISCMNSQNISNVNIEITNIATERQNRISSNTIRIEHVGKTNIHILSNAILSIYPFFSLDKIWVDKN